MPDTLLRWLVLPAAAALAACLGQSPMAGGATGIENPGIALTFRDASGPLPVTGRLRVFLENSAWPDSGLWTRDLRDQDTAYLTSRDFQGAGIPLPVSAGDSALDFNLVISAPGREAMAVGFHMRADGRGGHVFTRKEGGSPNGEGFLEAILPLPAAVLGFQGQIAAEDRDKSIDIVHVPGSPYAALADSTGAFLFPILPQGSHPIRGVDVRVDAGGIRTRVYCTSDTLHTDRAFAPGRWTECD